MHHPRCLDPATQSGEHPFPYEAGGCYLGRPGHCRVCPHRGQRDPRWSKVARMAAYAREGATAEESFPWRPENVDEELAAVLWPENEREWIARETRWGERAAYHAAVARNELVRELLREVHDLRAAEGERDG